MTAEERAQAALMLVFHSVLAAKPLIALHARHATNTLPPPAPIPPSPNEPSPGRASLPRAVALPRNAQNNNFGAVNGGRAQNTNGNATPATNPAASRDVPAQNMPRGTLGNENVSPDGAQPAMQRPAEQPVALTANGGPRYVPTGLDPAQMQATGHPRPPGSRPLTSVPPAQPNPHMDSRPRRSPPTPVPGIASSTSPSNANQLLRTAWEALRHYKSGETDRRAVTGARAATLRAITACKEAGLDTEALEREFRSVDYFATRFWNDRTRQLAALRRAAGEHLFAFVKAKNRQREFANWNLRLDNLEAQARGALRDYERGVLGFADGNAEKPGHVEDLQTFKNKFSQFAPKPLDVVEAPSNWNGQARDLARLRSAAGKHVFAFAKAKDQQPPPDLTLTLNELEARAREALRDYERGVLGFADGNAEKPGHVEDIQTFKNKFSQFAQKPLDVVEAPLPDREPRSQRRDVAADALARAMARRDVEAVLGAARDYIEYVINETGYTQSQKDYLRSNYLSLPPMRPGDCLWATRRSVGNLIKEMERRGLSHFFFADLSNIDSALRVAEGWLR
jgi:hypothetical protein